VARGVNRLVAKPDKTQLRRAKKNYLRARRGLLPIEAL